MITENNLVNWLLFMREIIPNKEDKKKITRFVRHHRSEKDYFTGNTIYSSRILYHKYWECK